MTVFWDSFRGRRSVRGKSITNLTHLEHRYEKITFFSHFLLPSSFEKVFFYYMNPMPIESIELYQELINKRFFLHKINFFLHKENILEGFGYSSNFIQKKCIIIFKKNLSLSLLMRALSI